MRWSERQRAMLLEMGVRIWTRESDPQEVAAVGVAAAAVDAATAPAGAPRGASTLAAPPAARLHGADGPTGAGGPGAHAGGPRHATRDPAEARQREMPLTPADWLVVGEAFDAADPQQEQLLDNMLRAIGVSRSGTGRARRAAYLAVAAAVAETTPQGDDRLAQAIATVAPRCIVAFGRTAAAALLGSDAPIGHWRGRCHERGAVPVVVTFSLAFLLRHPAEKAKAWTDLCLAVGSAIAAAAPPAR